MTKIGPEGPPTRSAEVGDEGSPTRSERARRLFFALWPDDATRAAIVGRSAAHVRAAGGRAIAPEKLHVTLAFLGGVAESRLPAVLEAAGRVRAAPFEMALLRVTYWRQTRLLCLQPDDMPEPLAALVGALREPLRACGFEPDPRPYRAHVTLAREARPPRGLADTIEPIHWMIRELSLIESITLHTGAQYGRLQSWPLTEDIPPSHDGFPRSDAPHSVT
jgi:2'-5' RNA ligase